MTESPAPSQLSEARKDALIQTLEAQLGAAHAANAELNYIETSGRREFENNYGPVALHPDFWHLRWEAEGYAPLVVCGERLDRLRG